MKEEWTLGDFIHGRGPFGALLDEDDPADKPAACTVTVTRVVMWDADGRVIFELDADQAGPIEVTLSMTEGG